MHTRSMGNGLSWIAAIALCMSGCGDDASSDHSHEDGGHSTHRGDVECEGGEDAVEAGTAVMSESGDFAIEILDANPQPQTATADNELTVQVQDADGEPLDGAELGLGMDMVRTTAHGGHGSDVPPEIMAGSEPASFMISRISYLHGGTWVLDFEVTHEGETETVTFDLCVAPAEENGHDMHDAG